MPPKSVNSKAQAALEKKAAAQASKDAEERRKAEAREAEDWKKGANNRGAAKAEAAALKADEALRKKKEKEALLAAEEEELGATKVKKSVGAGMAAKTAKSKKKGQNDLSLLEDALVSAADKKSKAAKRAAQLKKEREQKNSQSIDAPSQDPLMRNTEEMLGGAATCMGNDGELMVGSKANKALGTDEVASSGIDAALGQVSLGGGQNTQQNDIHPEKRVKALHLAFEEKMMPEMKKDYPGLKKSQYQEKIFKLWQKSPENPLNWPKA